MSVGVYRYYSPYYLRRGPRPPLGVVSLTAYTLTADTTNFPFTGTAATLTAPHYVTAATTNFPFVGTDAGLYRGYPLTATTVNFPFVGTNAGFLYNHVVAAGTTNLPFTGTDATLARSYLFTPVLSDNFPFTGSAASLLRGYPLTAATTNFPFTGSNAGYLYGYAVGATTTNFPFVGTDAGAKYTYVVAATTTNFPFTGVAANLVYSPIGSYNLSASGGSFNFTGSDASLLGSFVLTSNTTNFPFVGSPVVSGVIRSVIADTTNYPFQLSTTTMLTFLEAVNTLPKITLPDVVGGYRSIEQLQAAFDAIEAAFENTVSRDGAGPNMMTASLDMNGKRILNLPAPIHPTDVVRLQDLGSGGGGGGGTADWNSITNKPATFTPDNEVVEDIIGSKLVAGSNVSITYNDTVGTTTINATGTLSSDWNTLSNKPSTFTPSAHTHPQSDITNLVSDLAGKAATGHTHTSSNITDFAEAVQDTVGAAIVAGANMTVTYNDAAGTITLASSSGSGSSLPPPLATFGTPDGGGTNTANNDTAFAAAEASSYDRIYIPEGTYATTRAHSTFNKYYVGPGKIKLTTESNRILRNTSYVTTQPTKGSVGGGGVGWFDGDQHFANTSYHVIGTGVREFDTSSSYYEPTVIPNHSWFYVLSGNSGQNATLQNTASTGSSTVVINGNSPTNWNGKSIQFRSGMDGSVIGTHTVVSGQGTNTLVISPNPVSNYPAGTAISTAGRTWNGHSYKRVIGDAGGDVYGDIVRIEQRYQPKATETHVFQTSTIGQYGGDMNFIAGSSGTYGTGWESSYSDQGNDVAVIAQVDSFIRTNDTGARSAAWLGTLFQSSGTKPADAAHVVAGLWRIGLDTSRANFETFTTTGDLYNSAIAMAKGQRIVFNHGVTANGRGGDPTGIYTPFFGNVKGDMFLESGNDAGGAASGDYIALRFNRTAGNDARIRLRQSVVQINTQLQVAQAINGATDISMGSTGVLAFGPGTGCYATRYVSGSLSPYLHWAVNGVIYRVALVGIDV